MIGKLFRHTRASPHRDNVNQENTPPVADNGDAHPILSNKQCKAIVRAVLAELLPICRKMNGTIERCVSKEFERSNEQAARQEQERVATVRAQLAEEVAKAVCDATPAVCEWLDERCRQECDEVQKVLTSRLEMFSDNLASVCEQQMTMASLRPIIDSLLTIYDRLSTSSHQMMQLAANEPTLQLHLELRRLIERYDESLRDTLLGLTLLLESMDVRPVKTPCGRFDPHLQQVVRTERCSDPEYDGRVATVLRAGWMHGNRVLRPEQVIVYKKEKPLASEKE